MRYFKAKKGLFQLRYIYGKLRYPVHFVLTGFFCKLFIYKGLKGFFGVCSVTFHLIVFIYQLANYHYSKKIVVQLQSDNDTYVGY